MQLTDYAGARGRLSLARATKLPDRYWFSPKVDGAYCRISLDADGRIATALARSGRQLALGDLRGQRIGAPHSVYVGEIEAHTEAGIRARESRGYALVHLFDCLWHGRRRMADEPYRTRYGALQHARALLEMDEDGRPWTEDRQGDAHDAGGKYTRRIPQGWRRAPIVPLWHPRELEQRWAEYVERDGGEGLVAVAVDAPLGRRRSKYKIKATDTIDGVVAEVCGRKAVVAWAGGSFVVGARDVSVGDVVEVRYDGFYERHPTPRFPRLVRVRRDI